MMHLISMTLKNGSNIRIQVLYLLFKYVRGDKHRILREPEISALSSCKWKLFFTNK